MFWWKINFNWIELVNLWQNRRPGLVIRDRKSWCQKTLVVFSGACPIICSDMKYRKLRTAYSVYSKDLKITKKGLKDLGEGHLPRVRPTALLHILARKAGESLYESFRDLKHGPKPRSSGVTDLQSSDWSVPLSISFYTVQANA